MVAETAFYDLLGVAPDCGDAELKRAYKKASLQHHPDKNPDDPEAASIRFKEISAAYEVLSDPDARAAYDRYGEDAVKGGQGGPGGMGGGAADFDDILASMFGGGFSAGGPGGGRGGGSRKPRRTPDDVVEYDVSLEDLYCGRIAHFNLKRDVSCTLCKGSGAKSGAKPVECATCGGKGKVVETMSMGGGFISQRTAPCSQCSGSGKKLKQKDQCKKCKGAALQSEKQAIDVRIERGMRHGQRIVFPGMADMMPDVPETGDLIIKLNLKPHETFELKGLDLKVRAQLSLSEALLGFERIIIKHLDGRFIKVTKQPGQVTRPGDVDIIKGQGMPTERQAAWGDLFIEVSLQWHSQGPQNAMLTSSRLQWDIRFPEDGELVGDKAARLASLLPAPLPQPPTESDSIVDDEEVQPSKAERFGSSTAGPQYAYQDDDDDDEWSDEDGAGPQQGCPAQ